MGGDNRMVAVLREPPLLYHKACRSRQRQGCVIECLEYKEDCFPRLIDSTR